MPNLITCGFSKSGADVLNGVDLTIASVTTDTFTTGLNLSSGTSGSFSGSPVAANGKYSLTLTGGSFNIGNNITYLVPEELGAINKPLEHVTGARNVTGSATCYLTLSDSDKTSGTSRQFFNDLVSTTAMSQVVNKFAVTLKIGGSAQAGTPSLVITMLLFERFKIFFFSSSFNIKFKFCFFTKTLFAISIFFFKTFLYF